MVMAEQLATSKLTTGHSPSAIVSLAAVKEITCGALAGAAASGAQAGSMHTTDSNTTMIDTVAIFFIILPLNQFRFYI
jgi:hypothetical protein